MSYIGWFFSASSLTNEKCHVFPAKEVTLSETEREAGEAIEVKLLPITEAISLARRGEMREGQCALAILLCEPVLRERGLLLATEVRLEE